MFVRQLDAAGPRVASKMQTSTFGVVQVFHDFDLVTVLVSGSVSINVRNLVAQVSLLHASGVAHRVCEAGGGTRGRLWTGALQTDFPWSGQACAVTLHQLTSGSLATSNQALES